MCGIIGFNWEDKALLKKCLNCIAHRGPDDSGNYSDKSVSLGHQRLSIIDLSNSGKQPMSDKSGKIWITFNGEIYNHKELRKELESKYDFNSGTDTEVLIYLYKEYGSKFLNKLQGMFAFCIYDQSKKILFLARDRIGIKPLYYYQKNKKFMFCSELKGIIEEKSIKREINLRALNSFLTHRANILEESILNDIRKLMPGHFLIYDLRNNNFKTEKYWDLKISLSKKNRKEIFSEFQNLLNKSVQDRLMSDVPYGAYLSGGVDSGTIVSLMKDHSQKNIQTFSVGFEEQEHSETSEAKFLAERLETEHHELLLDKESIRHLPNVIYQQDEPMSDPTSIPIYLLSKFAKRHATVILTGEGADEILAGYPQYKFMKIRKFLNKSPDFLINSGVKSIKSTPPKILNKGFRFASSLGEKGLERFEKFAKSKDMEEQYLSQVSIFDEKERAEILSNNNNSKNPNSEYFKSNLDVVTKCQLNDFKGPMVEDLLMKVDKNTMAFGIEGRVPFLDHKLVEFSFNLLPSYKLNGFTRDKYILRKSMQNKIPAQTSNRKKRHFFVPIDSWLKNDLTELKEKFLSGKNLKKQGLINSRYIDKINKGFNSSKLYYSRQLWSLITFQLWYQKYIENEKVKI